MTERAPKQRLQFTQRASKQGLQLRQRAPLQGYSSLSGTSNRRTYSERGKAYAYMYMYFCIHEETCTCTHVYPRGSVPPPAHKATTQEVIQATLCKHAKGFLVAEFWCIARTSPAWDAQLRTPSFGRSASNAQPREPTDPPPLSIAVSVGVVWLLSPIPALSCSLRVPFCYSDCSFVTLTYPLSRLQFYGCNFDTLNHPFVSCSFRGAFSLLSAPHPAQYLVIYIYTYMHISLCMFLKYQGYPYYALSLDARQNNMR